MSYNKKRNKQDLESGRGWIYFIFGCLTALFLGGAVRIALSPKRIQNEIAARLEKAKVNVAIEGLEVSLNDGIWPRLGFFSSRMTITPKLTCEEWSEIVVENLYLPIGWHQEALAFRTLDADRVHVRLRELPCIEATTKEKPDSLSEKSEITTLADRWHNEVFNFQKYLNQVRIHKLAIATGNGRELAFQNLDLHAESWPVQMSFDWMLSGVGWIQAQVLGHEDALELRFNSAVKEGQAAGLAQLNLEKGVLKSELEIQHWPLQHLVEQARVWGAKTVFNPKSTWFTCRVQTETPWTQIKSAMLDFDNCSVSGSLGVARVEDLKVRADAVDRFSPFRIVVEKLDVRNMLQSLGREGLSGVLTEFGWLSGHVDLKTASDISWKGNLRDTVLRFSNKGKRSFQKIPNVALELQLKGDRLKGRLHDFNLEQGTIKGMIDIDLDQNAQQGILHVQLPSIELAENVQQTMLEGKLTGLSMQGRALVEEGQIESWSGDVNADKLDSRYLTANGIKMKTEFSDEKLTARAKLEQVVVGTEQDLYSKLQGVVMDETRQPSSNLVLHVSDWQFNLDRSGLQWSKLQATLKNQNLSGHGFWQFDGPVNGEIRLDSSGQKKLKWFLKGSSQDWQLVKAGIDGSIRD